MCSQPKCEDTKALVDSEAFQLSDWIDVHGVEAEIVAQVICSINAVDFVLTTDDVVQNTAMPTCNADTAWRALKQEFCNWFPQHAQIIQDVATKCETDFSPKMAPPFAYTVHDTGRVYPRVCVSWQGQPADMINLAHEFGHAVQLMTQRAAFIPPVLRETAAFLGELIALRAWRGLGGVWAAQNHHYLCADANGLNTALRSGALPYDYRWNYPLARVLAGRLFRCGDDLWPVFSGAVTTAELILSHGIVVPQQIKEHSNMRNPLPPAPEDTTSPPALGKYRILGMMAQLDLCYSMGQSDMNLGDYFAIAAEHLRSDTLCVVVGETRQPIGYTTWSRGASNSTHLNIKRQAAPFGDHLAVQAHLRALFPHVESATATYTRSARVAQLVW